MHANLHHRCARILNFLDLESLLLRRFIFIFRVLTCFMTDNLLHDIVCVLFPAIAGACIELKFNMRGKWSQFSHRLYPKIRLFYHTGFQSS